MVRSGDLRFPGATIRLIDFAIYLFYSRSCRHQFDPSTRPFMAFLSGPTELVSYVHFTAYLRERAFSKTLACSTNACTCACALAIFASIKATFCSGERRNLFSFTTFFCSSIISPFLKQKTLGV